MFSILVLVLFLLIAHMPISAGTYFNHHTNPIRIRGGPFDTSTDPGDVLDTPYRFRATNETIGSQKHTHEAIDHLVFGETRNSYFKDIRRLEETRFPNGRIAFSPATVLASVSVGANALYKNGKWVHWPRISGAVRKSGERENAIANCMNSIAAAVGREMDVVRIPFKWSARFCDTPVKFSRCQRKPDIVLLKNTETDPPNDAIGWPDIHGSAEDKAGLTSGNAKEELAQCARLIFGTQPDRISVLGLIIHQDKLTFVIFNRSGAFFSDVFDIDENPERFIHIIGGMVFADREQIGFDPTMKITMYDEIEPFTPYVDVNGHRYEIVQLLHVECVIRGRATVCFKVKKRVEVMKDGVRVEREKHFVVKNGWVNRSRKLKEPHILKALNEKSVKGIPTIEESEIFTETTWDMFMIMTAHLTEDERMKLGEELEPRQQVRVAMGPVGSSILEFKSRKELVHGFLSIVEAIEGLHKEKYLHRDVSIRNLLFNDDEEDPESKSEEGYRNGMLIDFDYAVLDDETREVNDGERTGTLPFMSVDLLRNDVRNRYYHDLESVFLDFVYVCCICCGPNGALREDQSIFSTNIGKWYGKKGQSAIDIGNAKYATLNTTIAFVESILPAVHPYFEPLEVCLMDLREIAIPPEKAHQQLHRAKHVHDNHALRRLYKKKRPESVDTQEDLPMELRDMGKRDPKEFFERYKTILQQALGDPALDEPTTDHTTDYSAGISNVVPPPTPNQPLPMTAMSTLTRVRQGEIPDDVLEHDTDLTRSPAPPPQRPPLHSLSCSGKRKADASEDDNPDSYVEEDPGSEPPSPLRAKGEGSSGTLPFRPSLQRSHSRRLQKVSEIKEIVGALSVSSSSKKQKIGE